MATVAPMARQLSRSRWMVRRTSRFFSIDPSMPSGCGRVIMTQRSICWRTSNSALPRRTREPTSASSPALSKMTLARKRRRGQPAMVASDSSETLACPLSWNAPVEPLKGSQRASCSKSAGVLEHPLPGLGRRPQGDRSG